jgi:hypothetical protein
METLTIRIHDTNTNEVIDRNMNAEELKNYKAMTKEKAAIDQEIKDKAIAKSALLERLGITAEEAALLLG